MTDLKPTQRDVEEANKLSAPLENKYLRTLVKEMYLHGIMAERKHTQVLINDLEYLLGLLVRHGTEPNAEHQLEKYLEKYKKSIGETI